MNFSKYNLSINIFSLPFYHIAYILVKQDKIISLFHKFLKIINQNDIFIVRNRTSAFFRTIKLKRPLHRMYEYIIFTMQSTP